MNTPLLNPALIAGNSTDASSFAANSNGADASEGSRSTDQGFVPAEPKTLGEARLEESEIEHLLLKLLLLRGTSTSWAATENCGVQRPLILEAFERLRGELLVAIKGSAGLEDYVFQLTEAGHDRAKRLSEQCTYSGVAPVALESYIDAVEAQSLRHSKITLADLQETLCELKLSGSLLSQLGQAINDGRGLFLYGPPGNGKTSVSERVVSSFGEYIWIPHTVTIDGELVRLYDPRSHVAVEEAEVKQLLGEFSYDRRWILIQRPTIVVGGELTMAQLELQYNPATGICEAPVQMRANCGALVIDDFGRQRMPASEMLNRLIVPMEKHYDFLNLASGRQVSTPFEMLLVFSTNLEPGALVDEAFLRRIPYKIEVVSPNETEFAELFMQLAASNNCECPGEVVDYLIERHFRAKNRPLRYCHPRDLIRQICNLCEFTGIPLEASRDTVDVAVHNYFAGI
ncbi:ATP-binding protein [Adhaeretor mobilis]|uniref:AAA+ ATPase domain-containing protein n=1 Tax=Adhaeretor mobilis TaxID=1930276 RepID=A0A517MTA2_9BACT|nr:AAA family ATPase [Adhaeretor mobilis]QDS98103.1 hypothetical protein HG15A2_13750 [Adhaeretor mobilis]